MKVLGASVQGANRDGGGKSTRDALRWSKGFGPGQVVVAMADGGGPATGFRSSWGAQIAVDVAVQLGEGMVADCASQDDAAVEAAAAELVPDLVRQWRGRVADDVVARPFTAEETTLTGDDFWSAYGSTIIVAVVSPGWILVEQLGAGDVLFVDNTGFVTRPLKPSAIGEPEPVHSLSMPGAPEGFRAHLSRVGTGDPELVLLATDGLGKAYPHEDSFLEVGTDLLERVRAEGVEAVDRDLDDALLAASRQSGDDVTAAVLYLA